MTEGPNVIECLFSAAENNGVVRTIVNLAEGSRWEVQKEAMYTVCNITVDGSFSMIAGAPPHSIKSVD